ncbi:hypothetical protein FLACOL_01507 [Flavobacterium columnare]|uniref:Uncharacterized protein n=2 Tax=Flavobacterium TaxID=237 RepID=A0ABW8PLK1_9FLAO|nr:hypothetical protein [Flavobacterium columnare]SPE77512.1 hypothetical protein FLACOL_01507 [Flavobacterium columnare]
MIKFSVDNGGFKNIEIVDNDFAFLKALNSYYNIEILNKMINSINVDNVKEIEFNTGYGHFIRIWRDKVEFGQYDDNFFHEIEQFKDYVDEGEIIFGSIPTQDFLEIVKEWRDFLIKCENDKEK